jgi:outer membrane protein OmpA-like peptidoglycan-associated protein
VNRNLRFFAASVLLAGCASAPRPVSLTRAADAERAPAVVQAKSQAPQAHARAQDLLRRAEAAYSDGKQADAELLGEHALAAYRRAVIEGRLAAAEGRKAEAEAKLADAERALANLDEQNRRAISETENLELKLKVVREILPVPASEAASGDRERARLDAARSFALEARLLCASARLLEPERSSLAPHFAKLDELDRAIAGKALPAPLDAARTERTSCLRELTLARRPVTQRSPATPQADALLSELSGSGLSPTRDDRGVVVTLRDVFKGNDITSAGKDRLQALGRVAKTHPAFPVLVVVHSGRGGTPERDEKRAKDAASLLTEHGAGRVESHGAGSAQPVLSNDLAASASRNERVEVVFVAPSST